MKCLVFWLFVDEILLRDVQEFNEGWFHDNLADRENFIP
jgi:hypothetical protein